MPVFGGCDSKTLPWMIMAVVVVAVLVVLYYSCWAVSSSAAAKTAEKFNYGKYMAPEHMLAYRAEGMLVNHGEGFNYGKYIKEGAANKDVGPNDLQTMLY